MKPLDYSEARKYMKPGDVIAFGGKGRFSELIKMFTMGPVSHVGVILHVHMDGDGRRFNQICESTSLNGFYGVTTSRLSARLDVYDGDCWWLPLSDKTRCLFNERMFFNFMFAQEGKPYDMPQAVLSAIDGLPFSENKEDFTKFFCSELVTAGFEAAGLFDINCSEVTPIELCRMKLYDGCYQLKGEPKEIRRFNSVDV